MTNPETLHAAAAELRAIALELDAIQHRIHAIAITLKAPAYAFSGYLDATSAEFHVFRALKTAGGLAGYLDPSPVPPDQPESPEGL